MDFTNCKEVIMEQLEMLEPAELFSCFACKEFKPPENFTDNKNKKNGKFSYCKECQHTRNREYFLKNREYFKEKNRNYVKNSIKASASRQLANALRRGALERQPCETCGAEKTDAHHDDYSKPLSVRWLCRSHHNKWHADEGEALNACTVRQWTPPTKDDNL